MYNSFITLYVGCYLSLRFSKVTVMVKYSMARSTPKGESTIPLFVGEIINYLNQLIVAVHPSQLRTMASHKLDPIDWPLPPPFQCHSRWASFAKCTCAPQICVRSSGNRTRNSSTLGNRLEYAATRVVYANEVIWNDCSWSSLWVYSWGVICKSLYNLSYV